MAPGQKKAQDNGWSIVLIDESGFMLQPVVRRTWAPKGETPIQYSWDRHDRLSVIAGITVSPVRCRLGLYFQIHSDPLILPIRQAGTVNVPFILRSSIIPKCEYNR